MFVKLFPFSYYFIPHWAKSHIRLVMPIISELPYSVNNYCELPYG